MKNMREISVSFNKLLEKIKVEFESYQDLVKIMRVKYILAKELKNLHKRKFLIKQQSIKQKESMIDEKIMHD